MRLKIYANKYQSQILSCTSCSAEQQSAYTVTMISKRFVSEFIEIIKEENAIWQCKSDAYRDKNKKKKGWDRLLSKYKEYDKNATLEMTKRKYLAIRAAYRRELRKIRRAKSAALTEDMYEPKLWYFDNLSFLRNQGTELDENSTIDESTEEEIEKAPSPEIKKLDPGICVQTANQENANQSSSRDEADIYAEAWAVTYRKLKPDQKIFAKRLMDDTLMYAQLGQLSFSSSVSPYS